MKRLLLIIIAILILSVSSSFAEENKTILILNSYSTEYSWTVDTIAGIKASLEEYGGGFDIKTEYMDTKNNASEEYINDLYKVYKNKYKKIKIDAIIVCDDNGFRFILKYGDDLFKGVPVFYCGINSASDYPNGELDNYAGIIEEASVRETVEIAIIGNPNINKIYIVQEASLTGGIAIAELLRILKLYDGLIVEIIEGNSLQEIVKNISLIEEENSILLLTFFSVDKMGNVYNSIEDTFSKVVSNSNIPAYGLWNFGFGKGIIGGKMVSGYSQGTEVSKYVIEYFQTGKYESIRGMAPNEYMFDYEAMKKFGINTDIIPLNSKIINKPESFSEKYLNSIAWFIGLVIILGIYIIVLRVQVNKGIAREKEILEDLMDSRKTVALVSIMNRLSHEMNTPLGNLVTSLSHMKKVSKKLREESHSGSLTSSKLSKTIETYEEIQEIMNTAIKRAMKISNSFKEISKDNTVPRIEYKLLDEINETIHFMEEIITKSETTILFDVKCTEEIVIKARPGDLKIILSNLIENSIKHGIAGYYSGKIIIRASHDLNHTYIEYSDNGNGSDDICTKVFDPFFTEKKWTEHQGLGLFTVQNIIHSMNGTIKCTAPKGGGLVFSIVISRN